MYHKFYLSIVLFLGLFVFTNTVSASVSADFGDGFSVSYNHGSPSPSEAMGIFTITNDETSPLTVSNLQINSTSMAFVSKGTNGNAWTCAYTQTAPASDFEGQTICIPNDATVLGVGESITLGINFSFENTSDESGATPSAVELTNITLNGVSRTPQSANLGGFDWNVDAIDDAGPEPNPTPTPTKDPETTSKVRGYVYFDDNDNDKRDDNEQGAEGVKIKLQYAGPNDEFDTGDDERYTDKTNEQGKYHFNNLAEGAYRLKIEDGQMIEFYLTSEKDALNGKSNFSLDKGETKERDFGYDRDRDSNGNPKNGNLNYLKSGFNFSINNIINYLINLIK